MKLLRDAGTQEEQIHYALAIRVVKTGWSDENRKGYFNFLNHALATYRGGNSFRAFITGIRYDAIGTLSAEERVVLGDLISAKPQAADASGEAEQQLPPRQFVRNWQMQDLLPVIDEATHGRDFERGRAAFAAAQCAKCHRFADEGGGPGPDLTGVGARFQPADVLESILLPSKVISDQYQTTEFITKGRDVVVGHVEAEDDERLLIRTNPFAAEPVALPKKDIAVRRPGRLSMMPEGLVDVLSRDEILDLIAYLRSGGKPDDPAFEKAP
jgi:putative heme-binding domain-containing protein